MKSDIIKTISWRTPAAISTIAKTVGLALRKILPISIHDVRSAMLSLNSSGRANHNPKAMNEFQEQAEKDYRHLNKMFPGKRRKNEHLDIVALIRKYHQICQRRQFPFGYPDNYMTPDKIMGVLANAKLKKVA